MSSSGHTLYATLASLNLGLNYEKLLSPTSGGNFLRYNTSNSSWVCSKEPIAAADKEAAYHEIGVRLYEDGMADFPSYNDMSQVVSRINAFFTQDKPLLTPPNHQYRIEGQAEERDEIRFSAKSSPGYEWLSPDFPSLIVTRDGEVFPSATHLYNLKRKEWIRLKSERVFVEKEMPAFDLTKQVNKEIVEFLLTNPQERSYDHGVVTMMQESMGLQFQQNPVLTRKLRETGDCDLSYLTGGYIFGTQNLPEFDEDGSQGPLFGYAAKDGSLVGRNWVGRTLTSIREQASA